MRERVKRNREWEVDICLCIIKVRKIIVIEI